jgi:sugar lactone lactonase YvrE
MNRALLVIVFSSTAIAQQLVISTVAGGSPPPTPVSAPAASIGDPPRVAVDAAGNAYFGSLHCIFKIDRSGSLTRIAGTGRNGIAGDGGPALAAQLSYPDGIAIDAAGTIYFSEHLANLIRRIDAKGIISTLASGDLNRPSGLALDGSGNLYVADTGNNLVRRVAADGTLIAVAGTGAADSTGDGGRATSAALNGPEGIAFDGAGNLYIADTFNHRIRVVTLDGIINAFAGTGLPGFGDNGPASSAQMVLPTDVAADGNGNVYIADLGNSRIRKVAKGAIGTVAGSSNDPLPSDGVAATSVRLSGPTGVAVDSSGTIYFAEGSIGSGSGLDGGVYRVWKVTADGNIFSAAGNGLESFSGDAGPASAAQLQTPAGVALDSAGNIYFSDSGNNRVRKIAPDGSITTVAGNILPGFSGDGGLATAAQLNNPTGLAVDAAGNLYIADTGNSRIREVFAANGIIGTLAGNGNAALFGDGGSSTLAAIHAPRGVSVDATGTVYIADTGNHCVRKVASGVIDSVGCGFNAPSDAKVDSAGNVWVADDTLIVLNGAAKNTVPVAGPRGLALDAAGNIYASDANNRIVMVTPDRTVTALAGSGSCCYAGDGGPAALARLNTPWGIALDAAGNIYVADSGNDAIRLMKAVPANGTPGNGAGN